MTSERSEIVEESQPSVVRARAMAAVANGDSGTFGAALEPYRRRLHVHAYGMLGSYDEAEDVVQETFLRAWRARLTYQGRAELGTWLYRIATNASLDALKRRRRHGLSPDISRSASDPHTMTARDRSVQWNEPYPKSVVDEMTLPGSTPDTEVVARETIELIYLAALQHLPGRQRAALMLRGVLGWSARETAELLEMSVAGSNSLLQRARSTMRDRLRAGRLDWRSTDASVEEVAALRRFMDVMERGDTELLAGALLDDARQLMPAARYGFDGRIGETHSDGGPARRCA